MRGFDITGVIAIATSLVGFVTVWVKIGIDKGRQEEAVKTVRQKTEKNEERITGLENKTHGIELYAAKMMGEIKVKLDYIKKTVNELKPRGERRAAEK